MSRTRIPACIPVQRLATEEEPAPQPSPAAPNRWQQPADAARAYQPNVTPRGHVFQPPCSPSSPVSALPSTLDGVALSPFIEDFLPTYDASEVQALPWDYGRPPLPVVGPSAPSEGHLSFGRLDALGTGYNQTRNSPDAFERRMTQGVFDGVPHTGRRICEDDCYVSTGAQHRPAITVWDPYPSSSLDAIDYQGEFPGDRIDRDSEACFPEHFTRDLSDQNHVDEVNDFALQSNSFLGVSDSAPANLLSFTEPSDDIYRRDIKDLRRTYSLPHGWLCTSVPSDHSPSPSSPSGGRVSSNMDYRSGSPPPPGTPDELMAPSSGGSEHKPCRRIYTPPDDPHPFGQYLVPPVQHIRGRSRSPDETRRRASRSSGGTRRPSPYHASHHQTLDTHSPVINAYEGYEGLLAACDISPDRSGGYRSRASSASSVSSPSPARSTSSSAYASSPPKSQSLIPYEAIMPVNMKHEPDDGLVFWAHTERPDVQNEIINEAVTTDAVATASGKRRVREAVYQCEHCGQTFTTRVKLDGHTLAHLGKKPFGCSFGGCSKAFARISDCKRHEGTHNDLRPKYGCPTCQNQFTRKDTLKNHLTRCRGEAGAEAKPMRK